VSCGTGRRQVTGACGTSRANHDRNRRVGARTCSSWMGVGRVALENTCFESQNTYLWRAGLLWDVSTLCAVEPPPGLYGVWCLLIALYSRWWSSMPALKLEKTYQLSSAAIPLGANLNTAPAVFFMKPSMASG
jgi:hypothetical protein